MGLFQKNKSSEKNKDEFHNYVDNLLHSSKPMTDEDVDDNFSVSNMALNTSYGIDQAIALMRDLPSDADAVVVSTVTKTLESANINVHKIIEDARQKESSLESQIDKLNDEIAALKKQIAQKKDEINVSTAVMEETRKVRQLLESSASDLKQTKEIRQKATKTKEENTVAENEAVAMALEAQ